MSSGEVRRLSGQDLQMVQNLVERCIQLHMSRTDAVDVLQREAKIPSSITELVWQRLEQENREFFEVYYIRLALKQQIELFNGLLKKQAALLQQIQSTGAGSIPVSNGSRMGPFQQNAGCYPIDHTGHSMRAESFHPTMDASLPFTNGASTLQTPTTFELSSSSTTNDFLPNTHHVQSSNPVRLMQGLNGGAVKRESGFPSDSHITFDANSSVVGPQASIEGASVSAFSHFEASSQPLNEALLGIDTSSFGHLGQIPKNFSFPDLSILPRMDFLDNIASSAFAPTDTLHYFDPHDTGEITDESKKLESISESCYSIDDIPGSE